jgi:hypothetical protein
VVARLRDIIRRFTAEAGAAIDHVATLRARETAAA